MLNNLGKKTQLSIHKIEEGFQINVFPLLSRQSSLPYLALEEYIIKNIHLWFKEIYLAIRIRKKSYYFTDGSKYRNITNNAYSIDGSLNSHCIRNIASVGRFANLSHFDQLAPNGTFFLLANSLSSLHSLLDLYNSNLLIQRILLTRSILSTLTSYLSGSQVILACQNMMLWTEQLNKPSPS